MVGERLVKGAVFLALIVLATGCRHKDEPLKPLVIVDKPAKEDVQIFGEYVGRIRAARFVEIHARVEGYLEKMLFVEGKEVSRMNLFSLLIRLFIRQDPPQGEIIA
ncbi:hypothetical protein PARMER_01043, partial [Parabacteroides merdae ATCC 43184]